MVFNALKRLLKPKYRIVACTECKTYYLQRRSVLHGRWEYLTDDALGVFATEFSSYSEARDYVKGLHRFRDHKLSLLIVKKCDA